MQAPRSHFALPGAALVVATALGAIACDRAAPACPEGLAVDEARTRALVARLGSVEEGAAIARRLPDAKLRVCFGQVPVSAMTDEGVVLLDAAMPEVEAAARLGHLATHLVEGSPAPRADEPDCDAAVRRALAIEARAFAVELRLRRALGVSSRRYGFEEAFWAAPPEQREARIAAWLAEHPTGGEGVDALAEGYRRRCERR